MNDRDRDLIIALIEGSLSGQDAEAASARIAADPELTAEYEVQRTIQQALADVAPIAMTHDEKSGLRATLVDQLNLEEPAPVVVTPSPSRAPSWWMRPALALGSVAAVLVIGVAVVPGMLGSSDDSSDEMLAAVNATTTIASADASGADGAAESVEQSALQVPELRSSDLDTILDSVEGETDDAAVSEELEPFSLTQSTLTVSRESVDECRERIGSALPDGELQVLGATVEDGDVLVVTVAFSESDGVKGVARIDLSTCVLVDVAE